MLMLGEVRCDFYVTIRASKVASKPASFQQMQIEGVNRFIDRWRFGYQSTGSSRHDRVCNEYVAGKELLQMQDGGEVAFCRG
jgi:hypothetical protein